MNTLMKGNSPLGMIYNQSAENIAYDSSNTVKDAIEDLKGTACAKNGVFDGALTKIATFNSVSDVESFLTAHNVSTGQFTGLKVGQTITITDGTYNVDWIIAGFDTNYQKGYKSSSDHPDGVTNHHIALIPKTYVTNASMNDNNVTTGGYMGSKMYTTTLPTIVTALQTVLSTHLLEQCSLLTNAVTDGKSSGWTWATTAIYATLMSEANVYGSPMIGNYFDQGIDTMKLPIFNFIPTTYTGRFYFWLRSVASASDFVDVNTYGICGTYSASHSLGVRPLILLG